MTRVAVIVPFRDRGVDPLRQRNLDAVESQWARWVSEGEGREVLTVSDGRDGDAQFNRSAAYNRGVAYASPATDVYLFAESDMLIHFDQIDLAVAMALETPGLVVPFTRYCYLSEDASGWVRAGVAPQVPRPEWVKGNGSSIGAINVVSRATLDAIGQWDETFEGSWYDDDAMRVAFTRCAGPTRWVDGPAYHLFHLPGWKGDHLTDEDRAATARNKARLAQYRAARTPEQIRMLTKGLSNGGLIERPASDEVPLALQPDGYVIPKRSIP